MEHLINEKKMLKTVYSTKGMMVSPHHLASQAGRDVLAEGGNAIEAMIAAAATIAVVYPHMNSIGGDGFWLIQQPGKEAVAIDAAGTAAAAATHELYQEYESIPERGPLSALTTAGTISGWQKAYEKSQELGGKLPISRLLEPSIAHAESGIVVSRSQAELTREKADQLSTVSGFANTFMPNQVLPQEGQLLKLRPLAETLRQLSRAGLDDFYRGEIAEANAAELQRLGSPLALSDFQQYQSQWVKPLEVQVKGARILNLPPPTQGLASLMILGISDHFDLESMSDSAYVHALVESTKRAFRVRDRIVTDPNRVPEDPQQLLRAEKLKELAADIDMNKALPWPDGGKPGDTVWMGCVDSNGVAVSFIQSIYWEFGSGLVLESTGVNWQNRGISLSLDPSSLQALEPGRKPFHTLNPAMALFDDGRVMTYGAMGGEGQPQTQAAVFSRYASRNCSLQQAVSMPRWLLGRTWGYDSTSLKLENRFSSEDVEWLRAAGHEVELLEEGYSDVMGHAGAIVHRPDGVYEGAADPRSDGSVAAL